MKKGSFGVVLAVVFSCIICVMKAELSAVTMDNEIKKTQHVYKKVLKNGLTVLVRPLHGIPKVCAEIWYKVGSKNERSDQKGAAHLIEHLIFKGTSGPGSLNLSETDIKTVVHTLSGSCNAFTSYDFTGFVFTFPSQYWKTALVLFSDSMRNSSLKDDHINSEMKAVIQELKMHFDRYIDLLLDQMLAAIFDGHPYHDPIGGYKHTLKTFNGNLLREFYHKYYVPNNATLVVVGDVKPEEVFEQADHYFGSIPANPSLAAESFYFMPDIMSKKVTIYRDVQQPLAVNMFLVPGAKEGLDCMFDVLFWVLFKGKGSRLTRKLVDELQLVVSLEFLYVDLFEHALVGAIFEPKRAEDIARINAIITQEIADISTNGFKPGELESAVNNAKIQLYDIFEDLQHQADQIGRYYLATGNPEYVFTYLDDPLEVIGSKIRQLCGKYLRPCVMHEGAVLPICEHEKKEWAAMQEQADEVDKQILLTHVRTSPVEQPRYAQTIHPQPLIPFKFPRANKTVLANGITLLTCNNETTPKIDIVIDFKAKYIYDPEHLPGLCNFMNLMLTEGTKNYTAEELARAFEDRGIAFRAYAGGMSMTVIKDDLEYGLELLHEILTNATFNEDAIKKIASQILVSIKTFWDDPRAFSGQLIKEIAYKGHPYSKDMLGNAESIAAIKRDDLVTFYQKYITPQGTRFAVVGDIKGLDIQSIFDKTLGPWQGPRVIDIVFPQLAEIKEQEINYSIARDQVVLCIAGLSLARTDPDYDKLFLFDQIFGLGELYSMTARLFKLREESGLFYTIFGSLTVNANEQPGLAMVKTIVSLDRLKEAEELIKKTIKHSADTIEENELEESKRAILVSLINNFETNMGMAKSFLFLDKYNLAPDFFDNRGAMLAPITTEQVKEAVKKVLDLKRMVTLRVGRV